MPMHSLLSLAAYLDQFCFSVSCAVVSSARQAFLSRPRTTDPIPAATQLGSTLSLGGPPARAPTFCPRDGPPARDRAFCPRGDALSGCCHQRLAADVRSVPAAMQPQWTKRSLQRE